MEKARKGLLPERALKNGRILGQIGEATQDPPDPAAPRCAPEPELTALDYDTVRDAAANESAEQRRRMEVSTTGAAQR